MKFSIFSIWPAGFLDIGKGIFKHVISNIFLHIEKAQFDSPPERIVAFQELELSAAQMLCQMDCQIPRLLHFSKKDLIPD